MWSSIPHMDDLITIKTNYEPTLKENAEITYPRGQDRYKFTQIQRRCASKTVVPSNLADFEVKVGCCKGSFFDWNSFCSSSASETTAFWEM